MMRLDERRFHRINSLAKLYLKHNKNPDVVIQNALRMGITKPTALSYLHQIQLRYGT